MPVLTEYERQTDEALAEQACGGDRDAFAAIYERHFSGLYDFAIRMLRQEDVAADVIQNTFMKAWDTMRKKNLPGNVRAWLYTVARNNAIDEIRLRKRTVQISETAEGGLPAGFAVADPAKVADPEILVQSKELVDLVWESAAGLSPSDYALLDLHLRQGLNAGELAASLRLRKGAVYTKLSRLRDSLEESVTSTLLLRHGRRNCPELSRLLDSLQVTRVTPEVRKAVRAHLHDCHRCQESKRRYLSPVEMFSALVVVPAPPGLKVSIWKNVSAHMASPPPPRGPGRGIGRPLRWWKGLGLIARLTIAAILAAAIAAAAWGLALASGLGLPPTRDPTDVHSIDHLIGRFYPLTDNRIVMAWTPTAGTRAYSVVWSQDPNAEPDRNPELSGHVYVASLGPGTWFFSLRTQGANGTWTDTVHIGPFLIGSPPLPEATPTPTPSPSPTPTPTPTPTKRPTPAPPATHSPAPSPSQPTPCPPPPPNPTPPPCMPH